MVSVSRHCVCRSELSPEKRRRKKVGISIYVRYIYRERERCVRCQTSQLLIIIPKIL